MSARMSPDHLNRSCWAATPSGGPCNRPTTSDVGLCGGCHTRLRDTTARRPTPARRPADGPTWAEVAEDVWRHLFGDWRTR